ncbi:MAG: hypothetical protein XD66_0653 [Thermacetogenium phaeum]|uniref:Uncharacterized protein n=1 Tax=Thermacetogenium phaeum TaxID=85874 RepID=A0A117LBK1_9THEO|nr:MAG: hypothetical protein XD66_0653 [Thermacetogenium phaeum]
MGISSKRLRSRGLAVLALVALLASLLPAVPAMAATSSVGSLSITSENYKAGAITNYTADFTATSGIQPGDEITMVFGTGYVVSQQATAKIVYDDATYTATTSVLGTIVKVFAPAELNVADGGAVTVAVYGVTNPTTAGDYTIALRTTADATAESRTVTIVPADPAKVAIEGLTDADSSKDGIQVTAGSTQTVTIGLQDQYGNDGSVASGDIKVKLSDTSGSDPVEATISNGSSSIDVEWTAPETVGTYTLTAEDTSSKLQAASIDVEVVPDVPTKADITGPGYLDVNQEGTYTITLMDANDNVAKAPSSGLSITLTADPSDGATFDPNPVTVKAGESSATFKFKSSKAAMYTITTSGGGVSATKNVAVGVTVLNRLAVSAPASGEVGIASEITISLKDQFGNAFAAPSDLTVTLDTDNNGTFYDKPSNGTEITGGSVIIPKGQSGVKVYYVPGTNAVGEHKLTFEVDQVLSDGTSTGDKVTAEAKINVGTGAELSLVVSGLTFTAGQRGEVTIAVKDGHGNDVPAGPNGRLVYLETESPTGKFYAAAEGGDPITEVTIPAGQASVKVYYVDTESWTKKALDNGKLSTYEVVYEADYSYTVAFRSEGVIGFSGQAIVDPAEAKAITLDLAQQDVNAVSDDEWVQIGSKIGVTDLIGIAKMRVGVVDQYGNPVPQNTLLRISVKDDSPSAFLDWDYAELLGGAWAVENDAWLIVTAPGTYSVTATAGGLSGAEKQVTFEQPALEITAPPAALPDTRIPVTIGLTNLWASGRDLTVSLSTGTENSAFYATDQTAEPIDQVTIPAYSVGTTVYLESDDPLGTAVELTAAIADLNLTAQATVNLSGRANGTTRLLRGWNIISTPWVLADGNNTIDKILANPDYVEVAYGYSNGKWYKVTTADPATMELRPLEALYVKLKGATDATFWAKQGIGTPPVRDLADGWNLVGNPADADRAADQALSSITGSYAVVISPAGCNQSAWVYTPKTPTAPVLDQYRGCWVYMTEPAPLAGQAMPPLQ